MLLNKKFNSKEHPYKYYVLVKKPSNSDKEYDSDNASTSDEEYDSDNPSTFDEEYDPENPSISGYNFPTFYNRNPSLHSRMIGNANANQSFRENRMPPNLTYEQIMQLEEAFLVSPYLTMREQIHLARKSCINKDNIKLWFRKRRLIGQSVVYSDDLCSTNNYYNTNLLASLSLARRRGQRVRV